MTMNKASFKKREAQVKSVEDERKKRERDEIKAAIIKTELAKEGFNQKEFTAFEAKNAAENENVVSEDKPNQQPETSAEIPDIKTMKEVMNLAAEKIVTAFFGGHMHSSEEELSKDLFNLIRSITKKDVVDKIFEHMECPLINVPGWKKCGDDIPGSCDRCHGGKFVTCPYWTRYLVFRIATLAKEKK